MTNEGWAFVLGVMVGVSMSWWVQSLFQCKTKQDLVKLVAPTGATVDISKFCEFLHRELGKANVNPIIVYEAGWSYAWPWMSNPAWRQRVEAKLIELDWFEKFYFSSPDELDDWTFVGYRKGTHAE